MIAMIGEDQDKMTARMLVSRRTRTVTSALTIRLTQMSSLVADVLTAVNVDGAD